MTIESLRIYDPYMESDNIETLGKYKNCIFYQMMVKI